MSFLKVGPEFQANTSTALSQSASSATYLLDGRLVLVWFDQGSNSGDIRGQVYNADGTMEITDDTRGSMTGSWSASGEEYCETFGTGAARECGIFKTTGDAYFAANSRLVEMQI